MIRNLRNQQETTQFKLILKTKEGKAHTCPTLPLQQ